MMMKIVMIIMVGGSDSGSDRIDKWKQVAIMVLRDEGIEGGNDDSDGNVRWFQ